MKKDFYSYSAPAIFLLLIAAGATMLASLRETSPGKVEMAGFATSLKGRTRGQRYNAELAARSLNGKIIPPGAIFSFNRAVRSWSVDQGYVKAPVSYDGELIRAYGGGVCQTSTTLYNAALLAGLPIIERHPHVFRPRYIPPGRDAAVAYPGIDLRIKNPYCWPIYIRARAGEETLFVQLFGEKKPAQSVRIETRMLGTATPRRLTRILQTGTTPLRHGYVRSPGVAGFRATTYRVFFQDGREARRERLSDDSYPAMNRVVAIAQ